MNITVHPTQSPSTEIVPQVKLDRLTICFSDANQENVESTCKLLWQDAIHKQVPGIKVKKNARYAVSAMIPLPYLKSQDDVHTVCFEAGPHVPSNPSYRLDFNPSRMSPAGIDELKVLIESIIDPTSLEFFRAGRVTRLDAAIDILGVLLDEVIVRSAKKRKHGVYTDHAGKPETVYLGTPRSARTVAYNRIVNGEPSLRIERRLKPMCAGKDVAAIANPFLAVQLNAIDALEAAGLPFPPVLLADSMRLRGVKRALLAFDSATRKAIMNAIENAETKMPGAHELWATWPAALISVGLGSELGVPT